LSDELEALLLDAGNTVVFLDTDAVAEVARTTRAGGASISRRSSSRRASSPSAPRR
jgi:hypothetical protein